ncbi:MAG TPA: ABC transporter substrate-binding protein [Thermoanaerobaculia bacterium]|nr:ABC transporter substrate-binding protein [Thermoanaerobaculia bacterium]
MEFTIGSSMPRAMRLLAVSFLAALLGLAACTDKPEKAGGTDSVATSATSTPQRGGSVILGWTAEPGSANEVLAGSTAVTDEVLGRVFLHLVEEQPDFEEHPPTFAPQLARSYEWSADHKTLTFHLRDDVVWTDGVPVTAEDVRWTWQAQTSPEVAWPSSFMKESITDVEVVDPHTVRFHFSHAYAKQLLDVNEGAIIPKHAWSKLPFSKWRESADWFRQHAVSNGPFFIASWTPQQEIVLERNPTYFEKDLPHLDRVVIRIVPDQASLMTQFFNGDIDFLPQIGSPADARRVAADPDLELISFWYRVTVAVAWNLKNPLFSDPDVRRALTLAIDRQTVVDTLYGDLGRVADSPIVTNVWAHDRSLKPWPYDPAEAGRILAAKGWKDTDGDGILDRGGKPFSFVLTSNAGNQARNDAAVMIQSQLKKVGIRVEPRVLEFNTQVEDADAGRFDATIAGLGMDTSLDLTGYFHTKAIDDGSNYPQYSNPEMDQLIDRAMARPDIAQSVDDLHRIQQIAHRDLPYTLLWESKRLNAVNRRVQNVKPNVLFSLFNLKEWWVRPRR